jgi:hypothetical protein
LANPRLAAVVVDILDSLVGGLQPDKRTSHSNSHICLLNRAWPRRRTT